MCFFVQTNHTRKELLFLMFKEINLRNHSSLHKLFYSLKKEIDIILTDDDQAYAITECKIFSNPHSIKYFSYEIDRMRTNLYLKHANKNFEYFENKAQYDNSYRIFLSNIIFPATNVKKWNDEIKANFIYYLKLES